MDPRFTVGRKVDHTTWGRAIPPGHVTVVAERTVANAVLMHAESLLGFGAPQWRDLRIPAIVICVVCIPIDDSCKILL